jgi:hypothetical protein
MLALLGQCFASGFSWIIFTQAPENNVRFTSRFKVHHRYINDTGGKLAIGIYETCGKFFGGNDTSDTGGAPLEL